MSSDEDSDHSLHDGYFYMEKFETGSEDWQRSSTVVSNKRFSLEKCRAGLKNKFENNLSNIGVDYDFGVFRQKSLKSDLVDALQNIDIKVGFEKICHD